MFDPAVTHAIQQAATERGIQPAILESVVYVESGGLAYTRIEGDKLPLIRWEGHYFYRHLPAHLLLIAQQAGLAASSATAWGEIKNPRDQTARYALLCRAAAIHRQAAHASCSWGVGQVMGAHAEWLGYATPYALAMRAMSGIGGQLEIMFRYIEKSGLLAALADGDFEAFARGYNGRGQVQRYAQRMRHAYRLRTLAPTIKIPRMGDRGSDVRRLQERLRALGQNIVVDGIYGPQTHAAVERSGLRLGQDSKE